MMKRFLRAPRCLPPLAGAALALMLAHPALAGDEIQVYNANIAAPGQFTITQHLNFVGVGLKDPPFPGGHPLHRSPDAAPRLNSR